MSPGGAPTVVNLSQYDDNFKLVFTLYSRQDQLVIEDGCRAKIRGTKTSGKKYSMDAALSGNVVTVIGDRQMTIAAGRNIYEIVLVYDGMEINTSNFILYCEPAALDLAHMTDRDIIKELDNLDDAVEEATRQAAISESFAEEANSHAEEAANSAIQAANEADRAQSKVDEAAEYASQSESSALLSSQKAQTAAQQATQASRSATNAANSASNATNEANRAKSWAVGPNGEGTDGTDSNNAKYWAEQAHAIVGDKVNRIRGEKEPEGVWHTGDVEITSDMIDTVSPEVVREAVQEALENVISYDESEELLDIDI